MDKHNTSSKYELDNTEIFDKTGKTIIDIQNLDSNEIMKILEESN